MHSFLELEGVSFLAQGRAIVDGFSYAFAEGRTTALVGPSGCGKSTVLKLAAGVLVPAGGRVLFQGRDLAAMTRQENLAFHRFGSLVFQDSALWANQSLRQILELPLSLHFPALSAREREERVQKAARDVGYRRGLDVRPSALSMGEQKLIAFARAIITEPRLLFLDEWIESLDDAAERRLISLVKEHQQAGHTIIFISHEVTVVRDLADCIVVLRGGKCCRVLRREELRSDAELAEYLEETA
jgi:ABC-type glutathione transport system ATPase component